MSLTIIFDAVLTVYLSPRNYSHNLPLGPNLRDNLRAT